MTTIEKAREIQNESEGYILMSRSGAVLWAAKQMAEEQAAADRFRSELVGDCD